MAETAANTYATTGANAAAGTPNQVAVDVDTAGFERQVVQLGDKTSNNVTVHPAGFLRVTDEPRQLFYDPFDTALDTTNLWNTPTVGNSAVLATSASGQMTMGTGTTASGWSKLTSQPTFKPTVPSWIGFSSAISLPDGAAPTANSYRYWGSGTIPTTPTTAAPMTDGVGFELSTAGKLYAVVYASGVRTQVADLSSSGTNKQPLDANMHRYIIYVRTDKTYWYIDGLDGASLVATSNFQAPNVQTLGVAMLAVGGSTPPSTNSQILCNGTAVWDKGKNSTQISDGTYPWRKVAVTANGGLNVAGTQTAITSASWTSATALNTANTISIAGMNTVTVAMTNTGTMTGGVLSFEISPDNTNWFPIAMARIDSYTVETAYILNTVANRAWSTSADGFTNFRVRLSTVITGTGTAIVIIKPETFAIEPITSVGQSVASNLNGTMTLTPNGTTGGWTPYFANVLVAPAGGVTISGAAGRFGGYMLQNLNSAPAYLQVFDLTTAVTLGTTVPTFVIPLPANSTAANGLAANVEFTVGINLANGLKVAATTTSTGATAVTTGLTGVILYK